MRRLPNFEFCSAQIHFLTGNVAPIDVDNVDLSKLRIKLESFPYNCPRPDRQPKLDWHRTYFNPSSIRYVSDGHFQRYQALAIVQSYIIHQETMCHRVELLTESRLLQQDRYVFFFHKNRNPRSYDKILGVVLTDFMWWNFEEILLCGKFVHL